MNDLTLQVQASALPTGTCYNSEQERLNDYAAHETVVFPSTFKGITASSTKPADTTVGWERLDTLGRPTELYFFAQGAWLSKHPSVPGTVIIWTTTLPDFTTFDGGDAQPLSAISGPMWEQVTALNAAFPVGAGTLPSTTVIPVGGTGGEEKHVLTIAELAKHQHFVSNNDASLSNLSASTFLAQRNAPDSSQSTDYNLYGTATESIIGLTSNTGSDTAHQNMPPFVGVYFLRRTSRQFYAIT